MSEWPDIEELIVLNQAAQGVRSLVELEQWFDSLTAERRSLILDTLGKMIRQAGPQISDGLEAVKNSGLKATMTPCVILAKGVNAEQIRRACRLPVSEHHKVLILLVMAFRIADRRRIAMESEPNRHWWHRNLADPEVLAQIRQQYRDGQL